MAAQTRAGNRLLLAILAALGIIMAATLGPALLKAEDNNTRKVTFYGQVGDGKEWAGGFTLTVTVNHRSTPYTVTALPKNSVAVNTSMVNRKVKVGDSLGVLVTADWPDKPCKAQLRGFGVDTRPATAVSPLQPYAFAVVK